MNYYNGSAAKKIYFGDESINEAPVRKANSNLQKNWVFTPAKMARLFIWTSIMVAVAAFYLNLRFTLNDTTNKANALAAKVSELKHENDTLYDETNNAINLTEIAKEAQEYGMVSATEEQIINYEKPNEESIYQYHVIPSSGSIK